MRWYVYWIVQCNFQFGCSFLSIQVFSAFNFLHKLIRASELVFTIFRICRKYLIVVQENILFLWLCIKDSLIFNALWAKTIWLWLWWQNTQKSNYRSSLKRKKLQKMEISCMESRGKLQSRIWADFFFSKFSFFFSFCVVFESILTFHLKKKKIITCTLHNTNKIDWCCLSNVDYDRRQLLKSRIVDPSHTVRWWNCIDYAKFVSAERGMMVN